MILQEGSSMPSESPQAQPSSAPPQGVDPQRDVPQQQEYQQAPQDDLRARIDSEKEIYRQKQLMKKRERELEEREQNLSRPKSVDDLLDEIMNNKNEAQEEEPEARMSQEEIIARAKQEIMEELDQRNQEYQEHEEMTQVQQEFTHEVAGFIQENVDNFPLSAELGLHNQISSELMEQLEEIEEEYGEEYAEKWFNAIDWNEHIAQYENTLAQNFKTMLKSDRVRHLLRSYLGEENEMPSGEKPKTLSRDEFSGSGGAPRGLQDMSVDDRVAYAKAELRKQHLQNMG